MTGERLGKLAKRVSELQQMMGEITMAKEKVAWLEGGKDISAVFLVGGTIGNISIPLDDETTGKIRGNMLAYYRDKVTWLEADLANAVLEDKSIEGEESK